MTFITATDITREELAAIDHVLANRVAIIRVVVNERGEEIGPVYRGTFQRSRACEAQDDSAALSKRNE
jgi:hypothetical protein